MIKLSTYSEKFRKRYFNKLWDEILSKMSPYAEQFNVYFPESYQVNAFNKTFFSDLLTTSITEIRKKYSSIEGYYNCAFLASLDMKRILRMMDVKSKQERRNIRYSYLNKLKAANVSSILGKWTAEYTKIKNSTLEDVCRNNEKWDNYRLFIAKKYEQNYGFLKNIFCYEMVDSKTKYEIVKDLGMQVCPYCNRQYINSFLDEDEMRTMADIDHFYYKARFPLFALSLYNFVPSCKVCNSLFKLQSNLDIPYPYDEGYGMDARFVLQNDDLEGEEQFDDLNNLFGWNKNGKLRLEFNDDDENIDAIKREAKLFRIEAVYDVHSDFAVQLRYKKKMIETKMLRWIIDSILGNDVSEDEKLEKLELAKYLLYGIDIENINLKTDVLGKLIQDISGMEIPYE